MQFVLDKPPSDGITDSAFFNEVTLLVSSWDRTLRVYDLPTNTVKGVISHETPVLSCCTSEGKVYTGGYTNVSKIDVEYSTVTRLAQHENGVKALAIYKDCVVSGSWDRTIKITPGTTLSVPEKVFCIDVSGDLLIASMANRLIHVYDLRKSSEPLYVRESSLAHQIRCVKFFPSALGFVSGCTEGRVSVDYVDASSQKEAYAFKCHRKEEVRDGVNCTISYPVNALAFADEETLLTGGSDGIVSMWDLSKRKKIKQFSQYPTSIASLSLSKRYLAISSSYLYENGEQAHPKDEVYVREVKA